MRPGKFPTQKGLLIIEAVICAVLITTGLVAISRGLSSQLQAQKRLAEEERMLLLVRSVLTEQERLLWSGALTVTMRATAFEDPDAAYEWEIQAFPLEETLADEVPLCRVDALVSREDGTGRKARLSTLWPTSRIPPEWF